MLPEVKVLNISITKNRADSFLKLIFACQNLQTLYIGNNTKVTITSYTDRIFEHPTLALVVFNEPLDFYYKYNVKLSMFFVIL